MSNIIALKSVNPLPSDIPGDLRKLADAIEAGEVESLVVAMCRNGQYEFWHPSSLTDELVLSTLLHTSVVQKFNV